MSKKMILTLAMASLLASKANAGNNNPATVDYVQNYVQSIIAAFPAKLPTGGTTGQFLVKSSNADYTTEWVTQPGVFHVGQEALGGIVFYVDSSGLHGLVAAKTDQSTGIPWDNGLFIYTNANGNGIGAGQTNTNLIVSQVSNNSPTDFAALLCVKYAVQSDGTTPCANPGSAGDTCYADWYLPSIFELNQMYLQKNTIGGFTVGIYWSSTESTNVLALDQLFADGSQAGLGKVTPARVRCIRSY